MQCTAGTGILILEKIEAKWKLPTLCQSLEFYGDCANIL